MKKELIKMGYREVGPSVWAKPVGRTLFVFQEEKRKISLHFYGKEGAPLVFCSGVLPENYEEDDTLDFSGFEAGLADFEDRHARSLPCSKPMGFLTQEQIATVTLGL